MNDNTSTKKINPIKAAWRRFNAPIKVAWRRFKDRMKRTWIGWFYICARRTGGGKVLLLFLMLSSLIPITGLFSYLSLLPYESWDELPCQTGTLVKVSVIRRGESSGRLVDGAGVEHRFYGRHIFGRDNEDKIKPFLGQEIKVCYVHLYHLLPPFYMRDVIHIYYPDGTNNISNSNSTPADSRAFDLKWMKYTFLWIVLPILLWLFKRHGREAWLARRTYLQSLSTPPSGSNL